MYLNHVQVSKITSLGKHGFIKVICVTRRLFFLILLSSNNYLNG